jgi:hypothetical protein
MMARQLAGQQKHDVEADFMLSEGRMTPNPLFGRLSDASGLALGRGRLRRIECTSALDLDEGEAAAAHGNEVDLPERRAVSAREDAIALEQ